MREKELYHYGILGQKWGVRRYQNEDGTYTEAGLIRKRESNISSDEKRKRELAKKPSSQLNNKELKELNERYNLENQRNNLERQQKNGSNFFKSVSASVKNQAVGLVSAAIVTAGSAWVKTNWRNFSTLYDIYSKR